MTGVRTLLSLLLQSCMRIKLLVAHEKKTTTFCSPTQERKFQKRNTARGRCGWFAGFAAEARSLRRPALERHARPSRQQRQRHDPRLICEFGTIKTLFRVFLLLEIYNMYFSIVSHGGGSHPRPSARAPAAESAVRQWPVRKHDKIRRNEKLVFFFNFRRLYAIKH